MIFLCPLPLKWNEIYGALKQEWEKAGSNGRPPPIPLILAAWHTTNDVEKNKRWKDTVDWSNEHNLEHLIQPLVAEECYSVKEVSNHVVGPMSGPCYLPRNNDSKSKPIASELTKALASLKEHWLEIAGPKLVFITRPAHFTGNKRRRLLVLVEPGSNPPWGKWDKKLPDKEPSSFTDFRYRVNQAIAPLHVDHIDFKIRNVAGLYTVLVLQVSEAVLEKVHGTHKPNVQDESFIDRWMDYFDFSEKRTQPLDCFTNQGQEEISTALKQAGKHSYYLLAFTCYSGSHLNCEVYSPERVE